MSKLAHIPQQQASTGLSITSMDDLARLSDMLAKSGFFSDAKEASQVGTKILAGLELGFPALASITGIHIVKGKPAIGSNLMAAAIKRSIKYNYRVKENTAKVCKIEFFENGESVGFSEFTDQDAKAAGTQNMQKFARNMLFARAISNGIKWYAPDLFLGPVYTPEELGAPVNGDGEIMDAVVETVEKQPKLEAKPHKNWPAILQALELGFDQGELGDFAKNAGLGEIKQLTKEQSEQLFTYLLIEYVYAFESANGPVFKDVKSMKNAITEIRSKSDGRDSSIIQSLALLCYEKLDEKMKSGEPVEAEVA